MIAVRNAAWVSYVTGLLVKSFTGTKDKTKLRTSVISSMSLLSKNEIPSDGVNALSRAQVDLARQGKYTFRAE